MAQRPQDEWVADPGDGGDGAPDGDATERPPGLAPDEVSPDDDPASDPPALVGDAGDGGEGGDSGEGGGEAPLGDAPTEGQLDDQAARDAALDAELFDESLVFAEAGGLGADEERFVDGTVGRSDLAAERDEYRDALLRVKADFDNYKKRVAKDHASTVERAAEKLVSELLPVLDACDAAVSHGSVDVEPIFKSLLDILEREGLERMLPEGAAFDPNLHEAVLHEPGEGDEVVVTETLRTGYLWKGRVIRHAMVKVRG